MPSSPQQTAPDVPRAATVLLLRPGADSPAPEVFTITRHSALAFSAGVSAFPGGRIDAADALPADFWTGTDLVDWGRRLGLGPDEAGMVLTGVVRETFEETGVLLARHRDGHPVDAGTLAGLPEDARRRVEDHELDFATLLAEHGLRPDAGGLRALSRWVTPEGESRRYDTYFFLAALPDGQAPGTLSFEGADSRWTTATAALEDFRAGHHQLMPPTWAQFRALAGAPDLDSALATSGTLAPVQPTVASRKPSRIIDFPGYEDFARDLAAGSSVSGPPA
ncbi:MAG: NUDIX hydrolase [Micrococcus sp.]|nr:NUDIX hydrolase [Micrococcus sp.]